MASTRVPRDRSPALDGLRGIAILLVVVGHSVLGPLTSAATIGVVLFFTLSGYLITRILLDEYASTRRINLRAFLGRRARRLLPALGLFLLVLFMILQVSHLPVLPVLFAALYTANFAAILGVRLDWLGHTWSLSFEEQFYLVWPIVLGSVLRRRRTWLMPAILGVVLAVVVWRAFLALHGASEQRLVAGPDTRVDGLLVGCLLAVCEDRFARLRWGAWASLGALAIAGFSCAPGMNASPWMLVPVTAACFGLLGWAARPGSSGLLAWKPLRALGRISYGVYLWHYPISFSLTKLGVQPLIVLGVTLTGSVGIAAVSWFAIERPLMSAGTAFVRPTLSRESGRLTHLRGRADRARAVIEPGAVVEGDALTTGRAPSLLGLVTRTPGP